ncbi:partial Peptidoglycan glycosyltransferase RodA, partial [Candidatus Brocadiaceae bacterium]
CGIAEEFGFVGSIIVVFLYTFISYRIIRIASSLRDSFMSLLVVGFWLIYFAHFIINLGMAIGVVPVIGIPLPFVSFGGSSLIVNLTMLGIIFNIAKLRVH